MTDRDIDAFTAAFQRLRRIFPLRANPDELNDIIELYFKVLRRHPLGLVEVAMDRWMASGTRFPKPAEWLESIPTRVGREGLPELSEAQAAEYRRAASLGFEDEPCRCVACLAAGVSHRFLCYVPEQDGDDRDVRMQLGDTVVCLGHWAHGEELGRWYAAREAFLALKTQYQSRLVKLMPAVMGT